MVIVKGRAVEEVRWNRRDLQHEPDFVKRVLRFALGHRQKDMTIPNGGLRGGRCSYHLCILLYMRLRASLDMTHACIVVLDLEY